MCRANPSRKEIKMANTCWLELRVKGVEKNIIELLKILNNPNLKTYLNEVSAYELLGNETYVPCDISLISQMKVISIDCICKWSLSYILDKGNDFNLSCYEDNNNEFQDVNILSLFKALNLTVEIFSEECGLDVYECCYLRNNKLIFANLEKNHKETWTL